MLFLLFFSQLLARQVEIRPHGKFEFFDIVEKDDIYKFKYNTLGDVEVVVSDPKGRVIFTDTARSAAFFANMSSPGRAKVAVRNKSKHAIDFSYKSPDPSKELLGHLGYVKDVDLISELTRLLDQFVSEQTKQIERTKQHQKMVLNTRFWARVLMVVEVVLTACAIYMIYKDFIAMFEKRQTL